MITKQDALLLLTELSDDGIDTSEAMTELISNGGPTVDTIKFIMSYTDMDAHKFYEKIRKSYNSKKSNLYINIVKDELKDPKDVLTTLASLQLQILLFAKQLKNSQMFLRHVRFEEISKCMINYYRTGDLITCQKLLKAFKADLKVFEYVSKAK